MRGKKTLIIVAATLCATAAFAGSPGNGRLTILRAGPDDLVRYRVCVWGDSRYDGYRVYYFDTGGGNFRVWYVLDGPNALFDQRDQNNNGFPDVVERVGADFEYILARTKGDKWFFHPDPEESEYLPTRDRYPNLNWPAEGEDYGDSDRWDVYCGDLGGNPAGIAYAVGPLPASARVCYSAYFNVSNDYAEEASPSISARLWGTAITFMFDAAETSDTPLPRWLASGTADFVAESVYPPEEPKVPGESYFANLFRNTLSPLTGHGGTLLYFTEDWSGRYWTPPDWRPLGDYPLVKYFWRATSRGDAWYTKEPGLERTTEAAVAYVIQYQNRSNAFVEGRAFRDAFELFAVWNWFTGGRDDGRHYQYGSKYPMLTPQNVWTDYPVVKYRPGPGALMNYLAAGYYRFDSPPSWGAAVIKFEGDAQNRPESQDWGGHILVTKNGATWTDLDGAAGAPSPMFSPDGRCIIQIRNPSQYRSILAIVDCAAYKGGELGFTYSFLQTDDLKPPRVNVAAARPEANPGIIEVLLGGDEKLYGAEADVLFVEKGRSGGTREEVEFSGGTAGYSFLGTYGLKPGALGEGVISWRTADVAGNVVAGAKAFAAGFLASNGGLVGNERAALKLPAGAVAVPTLFTIFPEEPASTAAALARGGGAEIVGPAFDVGPAWVRPAKPLEVLLSYEGLAVDREDYLSVYRWNGAEWEDLGGTVDRRGRRVVAATKRLGRFALGYGEKKGSKPPPGKPPTFALYQNYPNPARGETSIKYTLPAAAEVELTVYDASGRRVATLAGDVRDAGVYEVRYGLTDGAGRPLPSGVYVYRLRAGGEVAARKMVVSP